MTLSTPASRETSHTPAEERSDGSPTPTRVLFIIHGLERAGPELRLLDLARGAPETTEVHICALGKDLALLDEFKKTRAKVLIVPMRRAYAEWHQIGKVLAYIRQHEIDVVNSFGLKTLVVCLAAKLRYRRRIKAVHHVVDLWENLQPRHKTAMWAGMRYVDQVVCNGYAVKEAVIGSRSIRPGVAVIPNGVDCEHFRSTPQLRLVARRGRGYGPNHLVIGTVANVRPVKNYPFLLHAMRRVAELYPHARLLCVGGGPQLEEMQALAENLGLADKVLFAGSVGDIRPDVAAMDVFILCSLKEGSPNAVLQAMAMSVPVIASAVGEVPYMIEDGESGLLFAPTDQDAFLAAISRLAEDESYRQKLATEGRRRMESDYAASKMIREYNDLFQVLAADILLGR